MIDLVYGLLVPASWLSVRSESRFSRVFRRGDSSGVLFLLLRIGLICLFFGSWPFNKVGEGCYYKFINKFVNLEK